jgi:hypothetical protein
MRFGSNLPPLIQSLSPLECPERGSRTVSRRSDSSEIASRMRALVAERRLCGKSRAQPPPTMHPWPGCCWLAVFSRPLESNFLATRACLFGISHHIDSNCLALLMDLCHSCGSKEAGCVGSFFPWPSQLSPRWFISPKGLLLLLAAKGDRTKTIGLIIPSNDARHSGITDTSPSCHLTKIREFALLHCPFAMLDRPRATSLSDRYTSTQTIPPAIGRRGIGAA